MKKQFVPMLFAGLLGLCALLFADVKVDYNHAANFGKYRSYSWIKVQAGNELWQDRIQHDIDTNLQEKGWQKVESDGDAGVTAFGSTRTVPTLQTFYDTLGGGWFWDGFGTSTTTVENTPEGTLVVDVFDGQTKHLVWRGVSTNTLSGDPEKNARKL